MPQGTRLIGTVQSVGNAQQRKMFVTFHGAVCPDGFSLDFDKYLGLDQIGTTGLATKVDQHSLDQLLQLLKTAGDGTSMPSFTAPVQILCYVVVQIMLGLASAILFVINCSAFILYGVTALFGPVFVPLLMTQTFKAKFFHFLDVLISFAMIRAVAVAFIYVWAGFMNGFLQQTFNGNYSMDSRL